MIDVDDYGSDFDISESNDFQQMFTPVSRATSLDNVVRVEVDREPSVAVDIRFVVESNSLNEHTYGTTEEVLPKMSACVMDSLKRLGAFRRFATFISKGSQNCAARILTPQETFWTNDCPGQFTCKTCFNKKLPCMRATGNHQLLVLPLPPDVRDPNVTWLDKAYYIHPYPKNSQRYPTTWRRGRMSRRVQDSKATQQANLEPA
jgi:hypothetical protein